MKASTAQAPTPETAAEWTALARRAADGVREGGPVRLPVPHGRLFVDHPGPLLVVHRCVGEATGDPALDARAACAEAHRLATSQPAYLIAGADRDDQAGLQAFVREVVRALAETARRVLVVEVWSPLHAGGTHDVDPFDRRPGFTLFVPGDPDAEAAVEPLCDALSGIEIAGQGADVDTISVPTVAPPGLPPILGEEPPPEATALGLAVDAVFHNAREGEFYLEVLDALRALLAPALAEAAVAFGQSTGSAAPPRPALHGRRRLEPAADAVDRGLSDVSQQYGLLLQVTPVNAAEAWDAFQSAGCDQVPEFLYRPLTFDPDAVRRALFALPLDEVEDVTVAGLLRERRDEIEAHVRLLLDRETPQFLYGSLRLWGEPDADLVALARDVLAQLPDPHGGPGEAVVGATAFAAEARAEIAHYRQHDGTFASGVEIRHDIPGSLMVSHGRLLIGAQAQVPVPRVPALLAHEVGTHVLTFHNGAAQPLRQLRHGLAGYESLQEGLAVLAEWLVGGLTAGRLRILAARVLGADALVRGADFVETFRLLCAEADLSMRATFGVVLRLFRGGGLTKDMIYLRGLRDLLAHLGRGGPYWPLLVGKLALRHLPDVQALRDRGVLVDPPLRPRFADDPAALARLDRTRSGLGVLDLVRDAG